MKKNLLLALAVLASVGGALALAGRPQVGMRAATMTRRLPLPPGTLPDDVFPGSGVEAALDAGEDTRAARLLDAALSKALHRGDRYSGGSLLHAQKLRLLLRRGQNGAVVDEVVALLQGNYGLYSPDARTLAPALDVAVRLGRAKDADVIATWIEEHDSYSITTSPFLNKPAVVPTPTQRLAYAYLLLAQRDEAGPVRYAERAAILAPNEVPVLVQLADAYVERGTKGDRDQAERVYGRAYARLPEGSGARRDLRAWAYDSARIDPAGPGAGAILDADIALSHKETDVRNEAARAAKAREAARFREEHGMPPTHAVPPGRP